MRDVGLPDFGAKRQAATNNRAPDKLFLWIGVTFCVKKVLNNT